MEADEVFPSEASIKISGALLIEVLDSFNFSLKFSDSSEVLAKFSVTFETSFEFSCRILVENNVFRNNFVYPTLYELLFILFICERENI